jgi:uncharacterized protein YbaP (TraB family)
LFVTLTLGAMPLQAADYDALPEAKALAVAPDGSDSIRGIAHSQPHDLLASTRALESCRTQAGPQQPCEIVRLNVERVTSGAEIRARVPDGPHPLFLWRFAEGGTVVYLAGSIHILKPTLYPLPAPLEAAFRLADHLVLEVDVSAIPPQQMQQRTLAHALLPEGRTLSAVLPAGLRAELADHLADYGMTPEMLERAKPAMVMNQIVVSRLMALGYLPDSGLESHFLAQRTDQPVLELESLDDQLALLFGQPLETQVELLDETLEVADDIEPLLTDMLVAWLAGDDAAFMQAFKAQSGDSPRARALTRALLEDRNHVMADGIAGFLADATAEPRTYFVLVGAAHLVGEEGIVPLLRQRGYTGQRLQSDTVVQPQPLPSEPVPQAATNLEAP